MVGQSSGNSPSGGVLDPLSGHADPRQRMGCGQPLFDDRIGYFGVHRISPDESA